MRSVFLGYCVLDRSQFRRRTRAFAGWTVVTAMVFIVHIWAYMYQKCVISTKSKVHPSSRRSQGLYASHCNFDYEDRFQRFCICSARLVVHLLWLVGRHVADFRVLVIGI